MANQKYERVVLTPAARRVFPAREFSATQREYVQAVGLPFAHETALAIITRFEKQCEGFREQLSEARVEAVGARQSAERARQRAREAEFGLKEVQGELEASKKWHARDQGELARVRKELFELRNPGKEVGDGDQPEE